MSLEAIAAILEDAGLGIMGSSIFVHNIPASATNGILIRQLRGGAIIDPELPGWRRWTFMMIVRATELNTGMDLMRQAVEALSSENEHVEQDLLWKYRRPESEPMVYPLSSGANYELQVNIDACYVIV